MLFVNVKVIAGSFTQEQKEQMARRVTDTMVAIAGENLRAITWVTIEEIKDRHWAVGGQPLDGENIRVLAATPRTIGSEL